VPYVHFLIDNWLYILLAIIIVPIIIKLTVGCNIKWHSWRLVSERDWDGKKNKCGNAKNANLQRVESLGN
jgi:hypothetical protein